MQPQPTNLNQILSYFLIGLLAFKETPDLVAIHALFLHTTSNTLQNSLFLYIQ